MTFGAGKLCRTGSHMFDLALMFIGEHVVRGAGWLSDPKSFDPGGFGVSETASGIRIVVVDGCREMKHQFQADFVGDEGILQMMDSGLRFELWRIDNRSEFGNIAQEQFLGSFPVRSPMFNAVDDLVRCIGDGTPCPAAETAALPSR